MSDEPQNKNDADTLSALMAAAQQKVDAMSAAVQSKYNDACGEATNMVNAAKETFNQGMQKADQLTDAAKAKFNEGMEAAQQLANDTKAKFEGVVKAAGDMAADAKGKLEQGVADAKQQGVAMMEAAKERVKNPGESDKTVMVEAGKKAVAAGAQALGDGAHALGGAPGSRDIAKAWQNFQDSGGVPVAKMLAEQKLEDVGIRSTDATINKMADASKAGSDNQFNQLNKTVEEDARLGKGPDEPKPTPKPEAKPQGVEDSKFLSASLKEKYLARAQDMGQDTKQAATHWDSSTPKPPQNQPADKPAVNASPNPSSPNPSSSPAPSTPAPKPPSPSPSPSPKV
jgi:hypothetical protein